ncbi:hypothetical protein E4U23_002648 [Claviceps purpurea]|nr:hypothetical protein E4U23_002648 [Claviceps purpurea]
MKFCIVAFITIAAAVPPPKFKSHAGPEPGSARKQAPSKLDNRAQEEEADAGAVSPPRRNTECCSKLFLYGIHEDGRSWQCE